MRPALAAYCDALRSPAIEAQRASYRARERSTISEGIVFDLVEEGKLADPTTFTIDVICGLPPRGLN